MRADNMAHLSTAGQVALLADGVRTVVDLLSESEHAYEPPHPFRAGAASGAAPSYVHAPLINAADTDVVVASARAYVNALNRLKANRADVGAEYARAQV